MYARARVPWAWAMSVLLSAVSLVAAAAAPYALLGREAPDFALRAISGPNVRLSEHRGDVVVLSFWASACGTCGAQLEALGRSLQTYQSQGLRVLAINVDDDQARAREYARAHAAGFPLLLDPAKAVGRSYRVDQLPMTVIVDRNGIVRHAERDFSVRTDTAYLEQVRRLLAE